jgi:hypothetical protein
MRHPSAFVLRTALLLLALCGAGHAAAETRCGPSGEPGIERCVSGLSASAMAAMRQQQEASNWCWAASISMVLGRHGLSVPQAQVVRTEFGDTPNLAATGDAMSRLLNRQWTDARGQMRAVSALPLPPWRRHQGIAAPEVIADLDQDRPLVLGADQHAVVLVQLVYDRPANAKAAPIRPVRAVVLDPASELGIRSVRAPEWHPEYLARVSVEPVPGDAGGELIRLAAQADATAAAD